MNKVNEPTNKWGGSWTEDKLDVFENYVNAYLTIMNAQKVKYNCWPTTIYFDGFAGSGNRNSDILKEKANLFNGINNEELNLYKGSAERVLRLEKKFDKYYFVDADKVSINELEKNLKAKALVDNRCQFIKDDVNNQLEKLSNSLNREKAALVFLDPFGMQINWKSIEKLKEKRVDLWILVPTGVIINRLLDKDGKLIFHNKLNTFFGLSIEEIKTKFYKKNQLIHYLAQKRKQLKQMTLLKKLSNFTLKD